MQATEPCAGRCQAAGAAAEEPGTYGGDSEKGERCSQGSVKGNDFNNYFGNTV